MTQSLDEFRLDRFQIISVIMLALFESLPVTALFVSNSNYVIEVSIVIGKTGSLNLTFWALGIKVRT